MLLEECLEQNARPAAVLSREAWAALVAKVATAAEWTLLDLTLSDPEIAATREPATRRRAGGRHRRTRELMGREGAARRAGHMHMHMHARAHNACMCEESCGESARGEAAHVVSVLSQ